MVVLGADMVLLENIVPFIVMAKRTIRSFFLKRELVVRVYRGFGYKKQLHVLGHVLYVRPEKKGRRKNILGNFLELIRLFFVKPVKSVPVQLFWKGKMVSGHTEDDGFFRLEWSSDDDLSSGEHAVVVSCLCEDYETVSGEGSVLVPHVTQLGIISDIDDTLLISHSSTIFRRLITLFRHHAGSRKAFEGVAEFYRQLQYAGTGPTIPNPFFYVSSSEWNLYLYLQLFFDARDFPRGVFLLNQLKRWYQLLGSGKTRHGGKFVRIIRIMEAFPRQSFILLGDNSQQDPEIYAAVAEYFPQRIQAIYIREIRPGRRQVLVKLMKVVQELNIPFCLFEETREAEMHAKRIGLIAV